MDEKLIILTEVVYERLNTKDEHAHYLLAFKEASLDEERFLKQKSKVEWLNAEGNAVAGAFGNHYEQFLGFEGYTIPLDDQDLYSRVLDSQKADFIVRDIIDHEIKGVIFLMRDDKASGPDGFTVAFFKKAWVLWEVMLLVLFETSFLMIYHRRSGLPRCAFKVDIQKAYDTRRIVNLCFEDDLFLFARGPPNSVTVIMHALEEFKNVSEGSLPVRYLRVHVISSRILFRNCKVLVEKLESWVNGWRNKFLYLAG
ncbi:hypothetical protein Tco_0321977 [Tanacetum coccineum]